MQKIAVAVFSDLAPLEPAYALVAGVDLVVIHLEKENEVSVLYGRCAHCDNISVPTMPALALAPAYAGMTIKELIRGSMIIA